MDMISNDSLRQLTPEEKLRLDHAKLHEKHKGHEAMHLEMVMILFATLFVMQIVLFKWQQLHNRSYKFCTLVGMWVFPFIFTVRHGWYRMITVWTIFTIITLFVIWKATRFPINPSTPRLVYKWFYNVHRVTYAFGIIGYMIIMGTFMGFNVLLLIKPDLSMQVGVLIIFYGLYYGVLGRDCAELCADKMAAKMGYYSETGLPSKRLMPNICAVCGQELTLTAMEDMEEDENEQEKSYKLSCGHMFHEFCIRGWCIVGKKETCPYCKEKVDLKRMFQNPWERPHILFGQLLDWLRYFIVWLPVIIFITRGINYELGLE